MCKKEQKPKELTKPNNMLCEVLVKNRCNVWNALLLSPCPIDISSKPCKTVMTCGANTQTKEKKSAKLMIQRYSELAKVNLMPCSKHFPLISSRAKIFEFWRTVTNPEEHQSRLWLWNEPPSSAPGFLSMQRIHPRNHWSVENRNQFIRCSMQQTGHKWSRFYN